MHPMSKIHYMKNIKFIVLLAVLFWNLGCVYAYSSELETDSTQFETQRQLVNKLLEERSRKFGEYDQSLEQRTGIFGLFKSKADMQKSINILQAIVINDNEIFIETRKLLDIKDTERERFQSLAKEFDTQVTAYMKTVSKLQKENEKLKEQITSLEEGEHNSNRIFYVIGLVFAALLFVIYTLCRKLQVQKN